MNGFLLWNCHSRNASWQALQVLAVSPNAAFNASRLPALAAVFSLATSATIFSAPWSNLALSIHTSGLALDFTPSVLGVKPAHGNLLMNSTTAAFSCASLASYGALPLAMAPRRPKWLAITENALWRYFTASSG